MLSFHITDTQGIKKQRPLKNNPKSFRHNWSEHLRLTLPTSLESAVRTLLNALEEELQLMSSVLDDSLCKEVLETLRTIQHDLTERILELDSVEQLYYAYTIHYLSRCLIGYQGNLEQHQSVLGLIYLLLSIGHGSEFGLCKKVVNNDGLFVVIPAFSSMVLKGKLVLVHDSAMMEAFEHIDSSNVLLQQFVSHPALSIETRRAVANGQPYHEVNKADIQEYENRGKDLEGSNETLQGNNTSRTILARKSVCPDLSSGHGEEKEGVKYSPTLCLTEKIRVSEPSSILHNRSVDSIGTSELKKEYEVTQLHMKQGFSLFSQKVDKHLVLNTRNGSKSISLLEVDLTSDVCVEDTTGHELRCFDSEATRSTSIGKDTHFVKEEENKMNHIVKKESFKTPQVNKMPFSSTVVLDSVIFDQCDVHELRQARNNASPEAQEVLTSTPPPKPQPSHPTLWCWKKRLESVTNVHVFIGNASQAALEQLDTECQETVCHAIACVFSADYAAGLIGTLFNNNVLSPKLLCVQDKNGNTPLHNAVMSGDAIIVKELVGLNPSASFFINNEHVTPLDIAVSHRNSEIVNCLLRECVRSDPLCIWLLQTSLMKAGSTQYLKILQELQSQYGYAIATLSVFPVNSETAEPEQTAPSNLADNDSAACLCTCDHQSHHKQENRKIPEMDMWLESSLRPPLDCVHLKQTGSKLPLLCQSTCKEMSEKRSAALQKKLSSDLAGERHSEDEPPKTKNPVKSEISLLKESIPVIVPTLAAELNQPTLVDYLAQIERLENENNRLVKQLRDRDQRTQCTDLSSSSEFTDTSVKVSGKGLKRQRPLRCAQQYTDSVTSSAEDFSPPKYSLSETVKRQRKRAKHRLSLSRYSSSSGSDSGGNPKRRTLRPKQKHGLSSSYSSDCETMTSNEKSLADGAVSDSLTGDTMKEEKDTTFPSSPHQKRLAISTVRCKYAAKRQRNCLSRIGYKKPITIATFFTVSGKFVEKLFITWLSSTIHKHGYNHLRRVIHQQLFVVFGFSPLTRKGLRRKEKKIAQGVLAVVESKKDSIPLSVIQNLGYLEEALRIKEDSADFVNAETMRGKERLGKGAAPLSSGKHETHKTLTQSLSREKQPQDDTEVDTFSTETPSSVGSAKPSATVTTATHSPQCRQEESSGLSVLEFTNSSNPLDVIHSHMKVYGRCCPRHDIKKFLTTGTTYPPSDAFGPKRRYSSIKDIQSDPSHSQFDCTKNPSAQNSSKRHYRDSESSQVMFERPSHEFFLRRNQYVDLKQVPQEGQTLLETEKISSLPHFSEENPEFQSLAEHSKLTSAEMWLNTPEPCSEHTPSVFVCPQLPVSASQISKLHPPTQSLAKQPSKATDATTSKYSSAENHQGNTRRLENRCSSIHSTSLLHSLTVPGDYKDMLCSAAELLHAQDYNGILHLAYEGDPPPILPPLFKMPYIFITGLVYYKLSSHKKSIQLFTECLKLAEYCGRDGDITICNIYIGDIEFAKRRYSKAAERYQTALQHYSIESVAQDLSIVMPTRSAVWLKCGSAFKNVYRVRDSVAAYEKAIELAVSKKDQLSTHTSLGNLFQGIGENERAVKEYEVALELAQDLKDYVSLGWNHGNLGNALLGLHQEDKALHHLFKALDMAVEFETTPQAIGRAYSNLGTAFQLLNKLTEADNHYDLALAQAIYGNDIPGQVRVYGNIGNLQMLNKQYSRAVPHYTEVMRLSQDDATAHHNRGCAYYDWAEKKKRANMPDEEPQTTEKSYFRVFLHGSDFERCEEIYRPHTVTPAIQKYYLQGTRDLEYVIKQHEENFSGIKDSSQGLSLSVSLFETNSRTFHRMQDCLVHIQKGGEQPIRFEDALLVAEQSRARPLGELMLNRRGPQLEHELMFPPSLYQIKSIVGRQCCPVVYLSYTGDRLLGWLLYPTSSDSQTSSINMFEVPLSDSEFKSLDSILRYSEQLVEKSFEMYKPFDHENEKIQPLEKLYDLVARPVMMMLSKMYEKFQSAEKVVTQHHKNNQGRTLVGVRKIIIIPDCYTNLLPFTCALDKETRKFWGDKFCFQIMPSLLTKGILDQLPTVSVTIPAQYQQTLCVVGNPNIPRFTFNNKHWDLGKLPYATKEAEWVSHILQCNPILHGQATKEAVLMRIMNAKVIHLATHGNAVAGFLAFAGMSSSSSEAVDAKQVLIYRDEIESLDISPALVVLSGCDSGRGVFEADGIQEMARAFILAGAQAVLTALWRVPDESAYIFMQFFYQYLMEGICGTDALHKAILCLRCFSKYSRYIHWGGYLLTGREFQFSVSESSSRAQLATRLGTSSVFPRLDILTELETAFLDNPRLPTDVQVCIVGYIT